MLVIWIKLRENEVDRFLNNNIRIKLVTSDNRIPLKIIKNALKSKGAKIK